MNREYYVEYITSKGAKKNHQMWARTAREAVYLFKEELDYKEITLVTEFVSNRVEIYHKVVLDDIETI